MAEHGSPVWYSGICCWGRSFIPPLPVFPAIGYFIYQNRKLGFGFCLSLLHSPDRCHCRQTVSGTGVSVTE
jgi:hypothetical protein